MSFKQLYNGYLQLHGMGSAEMSVQQLQSLCQQILEAGLLPANVWDVVHVLQQHLAKQQQPAPTAMPQQVGVAAGMVTSSCASNLSIVISGMTVLYIHCCGC